MFAIGLSTDSEAVYPDICAEERRLVSQVLHLPSASEISLGRGVRGEEWAISWWLGMQ